ncbi:MAG TPA: hypothetical protein PLA43_20935 [Bryobacteraceae bacterium]|nr:hypothetical protein [Bryobacteraceae bacterium]
MGTDLIERARKEEARHALDLRVQGLSYVEIARSMHYDSPETAEAAVRCAIAEEPREDAEMVRRLELRRLDRLIQYIERTIQAHAAPPPSSAKSRFEAPPDAASASVLVRLAQTLLQVQDRRAALLGLVTKEEPGANTIIERVVINLSPSRSLGSAADQHVQLDECPSERPNGAIIDANYIPTEPPSGSPEPRTGGMG